MLTSIYNYVTGGNNQPQQPPLDNIDEKEEEKLPEDEEKKDNLTQPADGVLHPQINNVVNNAPVLYSEMDIEPKEIEPSEEAQYAANMAKYKEASLLYIEKLRRNDANINIDLVMHTLHANRVDMFINNEAFYNMCMNELKSYFEKNEHLERHADDYKLDLNGVASTPEQRITDLAKLTSILNGDQKLNVLQYVLNNDQLVKNKINIDDVQGILVQEIMENTSVEKLIGMIENSNSDIRASMGIPEWNSIPPEEKKEIERIKQYNRELTVRFRDYGLPVTTYANGIQVAFRDLAKVVANIKHQRISNAEATEQGKYYWNAMKKTNAIDLNMFYQNIKHIEQINDAYPGNRTSGYLNQLLSDLLFQFRNGQISLTTAFQKLNSLGRIMNPTMIDEDFNVDEFLRTHDFAPIDEKIEEKDIPSAPEPDVDRTKRYRDLGIFSFPGISLTAGAAAIGNNATKIEKGAYVLSDQAIANINTNITTLLNYSFDIPPAVIPSFTYQSPSRISGDISQIGQGISPILPRQPAPGPGPAAPIQPFAEPPPAIPIIGPTTVQPQQRLGLSDSQQQLLDEQDELEFHEQEEKEEELFETPGGQAVLNQEQLDRINQARFSGQQPTQVQVDNTRISGQQQPITTTVPIDQITEPQQNLDMTNLSIASSTLAQGHRTPIPPSPAQTQTTTVQRAPTVFPNPAQMTIPQLQTSEYAQEVQRRLGHGSIQTWNLLDRNYLNNAFNEYFRELQQRERQLPPAQVQNLNIPTPIVPILQNSRVTTEADIQSMTKQQIIDWPGWNQKVAQKLRLQNVTSLDALSLKTLRDTLESLMDEYMADPNNVTPHPPRGVTMRRLRRVAGQPGRFSISPAQQADYTQPLQHSFIRTQTPTQTPTPSPQPQPQPQVQQVQPQPQPQPQTHPTNMSLDEIDARLTRPITNFSTNNQFQFQDQSPSNLRYNIPARNAQNLSQLDISRISESAGHHDENEVEQDMMEIRDLLDQLNDNQAPPPYDPNSFPSPAPPPFVPNSNINQVSPTVPNTTGPVVSSNIPYQQLTTIQEHKAMDTSSNDTIQSPVHEEKKYPQGEMDPYATHNVRSYYLTNYKTGDPTTRAELRDEMEAQRPYWDSFVVSMPDFANMTRQQAIDSKWLNGELDQLQYKTDDEVIIRAWQGWYQFMTYVNGSSNDIPRISGRNDYVERRREQQQWLQREHQQVPIDQPTSNIPVRNTTLTTDYIPSDIYSMPSSHLHNLDSLAAYRTHRRAQFNKMSDNEKRHFAIAMARNKQRGDLGMEIDFPGDLPWELPLERWNYTQLAQHPFLSQENTNINTNTFIPDTQLVQEIRNIERRLTSDLRPISSVDLSPVPDPNYIPQDWTFEDVVGKTVSNLRNQYPGNTILGHPFYLDLNIKHRKTMTLKQIFAYVARKLTIQKYDPQDDPDQNQSASTSSSSSSTRPPIAKRRRGGGFGSLVGRPNKRRRVVGGALVEPHGQEEKQEQKSPERHTPIIRRNQNAANTSGPGLQRQQSQPNTQDMGILEEYGIEQEAERQLLEPPQYVRLPGQQQPIVGVDESLEAKQAAADASLNTSQVVNTRLSAVNASRLNRVDEEKLNDILQRIRNTLQQTGIRFTGTPGLKYIKPKANGQFNPLTSRMIAADKARIIEEIIFARDQLATISQWTNNAVQHPPGYDGHLRSRQNLAALKLPKPPSARGRVSRITIGRVDPEVPVELRPIRRIRETPAVRRDRTSKFAVHGWSGAPVVKKEEPEIGRAEHLDGSIEFTVKNDNDLKRMKAELEAKGGQLYVIELRTGRLYPIDLDKTVIGQTYIWKPKHLKGKGRSHSYYHALSGILDEDEQQPYIFMRDGNDKAMARIHQLGRKRHPDEIDYRDQIRHIRGGSLWGTVKKSLKSAKSNVSHYINKSIRNADDAIETLGRNTRHEGNNFVRQEKRNVNNIYHASQRISHKPSFQAFADLARNSGKLVTQPAWTTAREIANVSEFADKIPGVNVAKMGAEYFIPPLAVIDGLSKGVKASAVGSDEKANYLDAAIGLGDALLGSGKVTGSVQTGAKVLNTGLKIADKIVDDH